MKGEDMRATGIVRRIDDLGRIVIPKEIRRLIFGTESAEGKPMEFFMDGDSIVLKKYEDAEMRKEKEIRAEAIDEFAEQMRQMCKGITIAERSIDEIVRQMKNEV